MKMIMLWYGKEFELNWNGGKNQKLISTYFDFFSTLNWIRFDSLWNPLFQAKPHHMKNKASFQVLNQRKIRFLQQNQSQYEVFCSPSKYLAMA